MVHNMVKAGEGERLPVTTPKVINVFTIFETKIP